MGTDLNGLSKALYECIEIIEFFCVLSALDFLPQKQGHYSSALPSLSVSVISALRCHSIVSLYWLQTEPSFHRHQVIEGFLSFHCQ